MGKLFLFFGFCLALGMGGGGFKGGWFVVIAIECAVVMAAGWKDLDG